MAKFFMIVGLPRIGKTKYAKELCEKYDAHRISSDDYREAYLHNVEDQTNNDYIFQKMYEDTAYYLQKGENVVYDATNINYKKRRNFLQKIKAQIAITS